MDYSQSAPHDVNGLYSDAALHNVAEVFHALSTLGAADAMECGPLASGAYFLESALPLTTVVIVWTGLKLANLRSIFVGTPGIDPGDRLTGIGGRMIGTAGNEINVICLGVSDPQFAALGKGAHTIRPFGNKQTVRLAPRGYVKASQRPLDNATIPALVGDWLASQAAAARTSGASANTSGPIFAL